MLESNLHTEQLLLYICIGAGCEPTDPNYSCRLLKSRENVLRMCAVMQCIEDATAILELYCNGIGGDDDEIDIFDKIDLEFIHKMEKLIRLAFKQNEPRIIIGNTARSANQLTRENNSIYRLLFNTRRSNDCNNTTLLDLSSSISDETSSPKTTSDLTPSIQNQFGRAMLLFKSVFFSKTDWYCVTELKNKSTTVTAVLQKLVDNELIILHDRGMKNGRRGKEVYCKNFPDDNPSSTKLQWNKQLSVYDLNLDEDLKKYTSIAVACTKSILSDNLASILTGGLYDQFIGKDNINEFKKERDKAIAPSSSSQTVAALSSELLNGQMFVVVQSSDAPTIVISPLPPKHNGSQSMIKTGLGASFTQLPLNSNMSKNNEDKLENNQKFSENVMEDDDNTEATDGQSQKALEIPLPINETEGDDEENDTHYRRIKRKHPGECSIEHDKKRQRVIGHIRNNSQRLLNSS
ncbi:unnamed protein product [Didymodactylos carnosus]|uniref:Uncharacterized protein n=1 Tax=Didymodactylos carnosus TaxID=1234261 RepID=A0A815B5U3_9BILA|nr:unnamed protein product [Didymodactylos carnosus]CAF4046285.1 unnamed protein product [Didymodactylos carnosus]